VTGNRLWTLGVVAFVLAVVVFGWLFAISPALASADAARAQTKTVDAQNAGTKASNAVQESKLAKLPELKAELAALQLQMPQSQQLEDFLDEIAALAAKSEVAVDTAAMSEAIPYGGAAVAGGAAATSTPAPSTTPTPTASSAPAAGAPAAPAAQPDAALAGKFFTIPVSIKVKGTLDHVMGFVDSMQTGQRMFAVTAVAFVGGKSGPPEATLTGSIFVVRESAAGATTATTTQ
jgi:Tfp pilus assembly protein PilO